MTKNEYKELGEKEGHQKDFTVDTDIFNLSYDIWEQWYKKKFDKQESWDDLDLVRFIISEKRINKQYAAVFCDEAQDFTRVESELIIKLSKHSLFDLSLNDDYKKIPIAFAGDPNQTISPTGFRLGSIKGIFHDAFKELVGEDISFEEYPLEINYRSREGIVNFSNSIQYMRHNLLDRSSSCSYQIAWDNEGSIKRSDELGGFNYVAFYALDGNDELNEPMGKALSILTSEEGEYAVEVSEDANEYDKKASIETRKKLEAIGVPLKYVKQNNVYTAITAKGLEFKSSILYRFASIPDAEPAINAFKSRIIDGRELTDSESFALTHFLTKLYVAVSRAKEVLFVVDTLQAYDQFWKYLSEPNLWKRFIQQDYSSRLKDNYSLGLLIPEGKMEDYKQMLDENFNAREEAERLFNEALSFSTGSSAEAAANMKRAHDYYAQDHDEEKMKLCNAYYALYSGNRKNAGELFLAMGRTQEAVDAYWYDMCWSELLSIPDLHEMQKIVSGLMINTLDIKQFLRIWKTCEDDINKSIRDIERTEKLWVKVAEKILLEVNKLDKTEISDALIHSYEDLSGYIDFYGVEVQQSLAILHYKRAKFLNQGRDFESDNLDKTDFLIAIGIWNNIGEVVLRELM